jgi:hypothetical protein
MYRIYDVKMVDLHVHVEDGWRQCYEYHYHVGPSP